MAEIGYITLILALVVSLYSVFAFILGEYKKHTLLINTARSSIFIVFLLVSASVVALLTALISHDFSIDYVASYSSSNMSLPYLISALWAGNDGSLLFWGWLLSLFAAIVVLKKSSIDKPFMPYASSIIMITQVFFLILIVSISNPFEKLPFTPSDGYGLNPLLENPGMIFHPPTLLAGYVGLTIPFALVIAALIKSRFDNDWLASVRRWALFAWLLLGIGNIIGAWWAYVELGWGGYWAWDPVENAGLMPWLLVTAFIHSVAMQRRRRSFKIWTSVLIVLTFAMSIFGTYLTRSGILSSVHAFTDTGLGTFFLTFIIITLIVSVGLIIYRKTDLRSEIQTDSIISREGTFLLNNLLLIGATFAILLGTVFPIISRTLSGTEITLDSTFFNQVNVPLFMVIILLSGICAIVGWQQASVRNLVRRLILPLALAVVVGILLVILGVRQWFAVGAFFICSFVFLSIINEWFRATWRRRKTRKESHQKAFFGLIWSNKPRYGGFIVHVAIVLIAVGIIGSSFYGVEKEVTLEPGESITVERYDLIYEGIDRYTDTNKIIVTGAITVNSGNKVIGQLYPEKYFHQSYEQWVTEVAIRSTPIEDLYVILLGWDEQDVAVFSILVNPLVSWIWIGGGLFLLGGLIAFWPERRRVPVEELETVQVKKAATELLDTQESSQRNDLEDEIEKQVMTLRKDKK